MGLFDFFKSDKNQNAELSTDAKIAAAIEVFEQNPNASPGQIIGWIDRKIDNEKIATDLYRMLPTAYCRETLKEVDFPDTYMTADGSGEYNVSNSFSENAFYQDVVRIARAHMATPAGKGNTFHILRHSAEFDAINNALHGGATLENLVLSPPVFV